VSIYRGIVRCPVALRVPCAEVYTAAAVDPHEPAYVEVVAVVVTRAAQVRRTVRAHVVTEQFSGGNGSSIEDVSRGIRGYGHDAEPGSADASRLCRAQIGKGADSRVVDIPMKAASLQVARVDFGIVHRRHVNLAVVPSRARVELFRGLPRLPVGGRFRGRSCIPDVNKLIGARRQPVERGISHVIHPANVDVTGRCRSHRMPAHVRLEAVRRLPKLPEPGPADAAGPADGIDGAAGRCETTEKGHDYQRGRPHRATEAISPSPSHSMQPS
jgi:hypothetical protein